MAGAALDACASIEEIRLTLPNKHRILVDLERFGKTNVNEIFVSADEPFGVISGTLRRGERV
jgi:urate oxidase